MADIAGKQFRAEQLREKLAVLRVQHSADMTTASEATHEAKLDAEIAALEEQVAIEQIKVETGGSVIDAMEVMAQAAEAERKAQAAKKSADSSGENENSKPEDVKPESKEEIKVQSGLNLMGGNQ